MSIPQEQIDSIVSQLHLFGDDGVAFDDWMTAVSSYVRSHGHVGAFRTEARSLWLSHNKKGVETLVRNLLGGLSVEERESLKTGDMAGSLSDTAYYRFLTKMGICRGDTLSVHTATGEMVGLRFDDERLPERVPGEGTVPKKTRARKTKPDDNVE